MKLFRLAFLLSVAFLAFAGRSESQELPWTVDATTGYAGFVDDATKHFLAVGGSVRKYLTPLVSVGPEFVLMESTSETEVTNRHLMLTGNVVYDIYDASGPGSRRVTPFLVGGLGWFWTREQFFTGPFWSSDPAFTAGGGVRARVADRVSLAAEYRLGWELHQRFTGSITIELR